MHQLQSEVQELEQDLEESNNKADEDVERLEQGKRVLESAKSRAEDQVKNLEQTIARLQEAEGNLSGKELALKQSLDTERRRFEAERDALQKDLEQAQNDCQSQRKSARESDAEFKSLHKELESAHSREAELQDRAQSLEDELEVLQSTLDDEANRANDEVDAAKSEVEGLRRQLTGLHKDLAQAQSENADFNAEIENLKATAATQRRSKTPSPVSRQSPATVGRTKQEQEAKVSDLEARVQDLTIQLTRARKDRTDTQSKLFDTEGTLQSARTELKCLQSKAADTTPTADRHSRNQQLQNLLTDTQAQLSRANKGKRSLEDSLAYTTAEFSALKSAISDFESERDSARDSVREMRTKTQTRERESEKKFQSQVVRYERDIQNLEQDLEGADAKVKDREDKLQELEGGLRALKKKSKELERQLQARPQQQAGGSAEGTTDVPVTKEEMDNLRLELEDADAQISSLQTHSRSTKQKLIDETSRSKDLAAQLKKSRKDTSSLLKQAQAQSQHQHAGAAADLADLDHEKAAAQLKLRHRAELTTLARQIEFLNAAYRREQGFRVDLAYAKREWFDKVLKRRDVFVERDLKIVQGMGVDTEAVKEGLKGRRVVSTRDETAHKGTGRSDLQLNMDFDVDDQEIAIPIDSIRPSGSHARPSRSQQPQHQLAEHQRHSSKAQRKLTLGLKAVRAIVRMQLAAGRWKAVTSKHDEILAKLAQRPGKGANGGKGKASTGAFMYGDEKVRKVSVLGKRK